MRRSRPIVVLAGLLIAGLTMLAWTQTWFTVHLDATSAVATTVHADGSDAVSSYSALAIASLALFLALTIAGPVVRIVLAAIEILLGVAIVVSGVSAIADPVRAASSAVSTVAGVQDLDAVRRVVTATTTTAWPYVGVASGVLAALLGVVVIVVQRRWPGPTRKYGATTDRPGAAPATNRPTPPRDAVVDWDDLSAGVDPTSAAERTGVEETAAASGRGTSSGSRSGDTIGLGERPQPGRSGTNEEHREH
jgi:uncharacterized membrane protein (TIGR02234 family)